MLGILFSIPFLTWGYFSIQAGMASGAFGPILGGCLSLTFGTVIFMVSLYHLIDKVLDRSNQKGLVRQPYDH